VVLLVRNLELGIRRLAKIGEFLALVSLSQVGDSDQAIFLLAEVTLNQWVALRRTVILLDMKIAAVFVILHPTLVRSLSFIDNTAMADFEDQNCQPQCDTECGSPRLGIAKVRRARGATASRSLLGRLQLRFGCSDMQRCDVGWIGLISKSLVPLRR